MIKSYSCTGLFLAGPTRAMGSMWQDWRGFRVGSTSGLRRF